MSMAPKIPVGTIDLTPTWESILPTLELLLVDGNSKARAVARDELRRMARVADLHLVQSKTPACRPHVARPWPDLG